jgi:enterochelin esterase family protein
MGGRQSRQIGFRNLDTFGSFGLFSAGRVDSDASFEAFLADPETNDKIDLLFTGLGSLEVAERYGGRLHNTLVEHDIDHEYHVSAAGHEWITWRDQLHARFLPQLWRHLDETTQE